MYVFHTFDLNISTLLHKYVCFSYFLPPTRHAAGPLTTSSATKTTAERSREGLANNARRPTRKLGPSAVRRRPHPPPQSTKNIKKALQICVFLEISPQNINFIA